ncbi:hypothetical protein FIBSPDRAFT_856698 [Athelia psychrophila]|uniref:Uncharacterized protein n=1 Tax=Athelia psychrophila TaxID=1759441 RepID=A0A166N0A2_9AGAM|nr:hypothetical protein FIBSPDRAFT_878030 [Fibularhizoctonia sp. CBS 109695]KZP24512.1 hypothetical protein FIBSPDRAFT_856698 [Fibularhizoctonia sp. CBS 109695]
MYYFSYSDAIIIARTRCDALNCKAWQDRWQGPGQLPQEQSGLATGTSSSRGQRQSRTKPATSAHSADSLSTGDPILTGCLSDEHQF